MRNRLSPLMQQWIGICNKLGEAENPFLFIVDYKMEKPLVFPTEEIPEHIYYSFNSKNERAQNIKLLFDNPEFDTYKKGYDLIQEHIARGDSYLVNYTVQTPLHNDISLKQIYEAANSRYKLLIEDQFVMFSPETFVKINEDGIISTYPMKGTIEASIEHARTKILENPKEAAEHATVVDLLRNDLSRVAECVEVIKYRYIEEIATSSKNLLQVSSHIQGKLHKNWKGNIGTILSEMLPAGSVTGAPKTKTLDVISEAEIYDRGYYTGICGIFDGKKVDSAVMIRFVEQQDGKLLFKSGGGITSMSKITEEYNEIKNKIYVPIS